MAYARVGALCPLHGRPAPPERRSSSIRNRYFMRSITSSSPDRRTRRLADRSARRARRRPAIATSALALGLIAAVGLSTAPAAQAGASGTSPGIALASFTTAIEPTPVVSPTGTDDISTAMQAELTAADASLAAATAVASDISASGLDIGVPETTVDTAALEDAIDRLESATDLPAPLVPDLTEDVTEHRTVVDGQVASLRGSLEAAQAKKAEEEAAEKARLEAEAAARAAEAPAPRSSAAGVPMAAGGAVGGTSPADAQATARSMLGGYGWGDDQFSCLVSLWHKESGWRYNAYNASSGATGIPQALPGSKMASAGADWQTNPATQIRWGLGYIQGRYGSPCGAWSHSQSVGWY